GSTADVADDNGVRPERGALPGRATGDPMSPAAIGSARSTVGKAVARCTTAPVAAGPTVRTADGSPAAAAGCPSALPEDSSAVGTPNGASEIAADDASPGARRRPRARAPDGCAAVSGTSAFR